MPGLDFGCGQRRNVLYSVQQNKAGRPDRTGCVSLKKVNAYLLQRPKMLLTMVWVFTLLAIGLGVTLIIAFPNMGILPFWGYLIVPAALALYTRLLYSKVQERRMEERRAQKEAENEIRYPHKKKKR